MKHALSILAVLLATSAQAATIKDLFPPGKNACFAYENNKARKGEVEAFELFKIFGKNRTEEDIAGNFEEESKRAGDEGYTILDVQVRLKGDKRAYYQSVICNENDGDPRCAVECDGGYFKTKVKQNALDIAFDDRGLVVQGGCGEEDEISRLIGRKEAPKGLTLKPYKGEHCEIARSKNVATRLGDSVSLRTRILEDKWLCLGRTYDDAHLKKHPRQMVKRITAEIIELPKRVTTPEGDTNTTMQLKLKTQLRDGSYNTSLEECFAYDTEFVCGDHFRLFRRDDKTALLKTGKYEGEDKEDGYKPRLGDAKIGSDDKVFKLGASTKACVWE